MESVPILLWPISCLLSGSRRLLFSWRRSRALRWSASLEIGRISASRLGDARASMTPRSPRTRTEAGSAG